MKELEHEKEELQNEIAVKRHDQNFMSKELDRYEQKYTAIKTDYNKLVGKYDHL